MPDHLAHSEEYSEADGLKLSAATAAAHMKDPAAAEEDYDMAEHHHHHHHQANGEEYGGEHEYGDYDMGDADLEHQGAGEYAENMASTDAGSILATQDNGEEQLLDDEAQQGGEYAYEGEEPMDEGGKTQDVDEHGHPMHPQAEMYDDQGAHLYSAGADDASAIEYSMMDSGAADTSSLAALTRAITSSDARQHAQEAHDDASQHGDDHDHDHDGAAGESPASHGSGAQGLATPMRFTPRPLMLDGAEGGGQGLVTPVKRPHSAHSGDGSSASRLKSKVWNWYDITDDGQRQCRFCMQKYGRLTATTILARHYHNRHDPNPPPMSAQTPSHRAPRPQPHLSLSPAHAVYSQAAAAAAVVAAAAHAATPDAQATHLFHAQPNGAAASDDLLRSASEDAEQHAAGSYDDSQLIIQAGFSSMMTAPLARIGLTPARKALAAVAQFCATADPQKNLQTCVELIAAA
ncbi:hypothetical protein IWW47_004923, partial [Coemansia sp. RSA 2052]